MLRGILIKSLPYFVTKGLSWKRIRWPWSTSLSPSTSPPISCSNERHIMEACHKTVKTWRLEKTCSLLEIYSRTYKGHRASIYRYHKESRWKSVKLTWSFHITHRLVLVYTFVNFQHLTRPFSSQFYEEHFKEKNVNINFFQINFGNAVIFYLFVSFLTYG